MAIGHDGTDWPEPVHHVNCTTVPSLLLTVPEACEALRVSRAQLYVMPNKQHVIEMVHIGKLCRMPRASIQEYVDSVRYMAMAEQTFGNLFGLFESEVERS
jgi:excisionase family DNA binding protein